MPNILQIARDVLSGREYPSENIFEMKLKAYAEHEHHGGSGHSLRPSPLRLHNAVPGGCDYHRQYADGHRPAKEAHADADQSRFDGHESERHVHAPLSDPLAPLHFRRPSPATEIAVRLLRV